MPSPSLLCYFQVASIMAEFFCYFQSCDSIFGYILTYHIDLHPLLGADEVSGDVVEAGHVTIHVVEGH